MRKLVNLLMAVVGVVLCFVMASCAEDNSKTKIGLVMYQWTDTQGKNMQNYCEYLEANFPVEFEYESTYYQDDKHLECVENLISKGCKAIIAGYDTSLESAIATCQDAGVYYIVALDYIAGSDFEGGIPSTEYFLGGTQQFGGDLAALGAAYAKAVIANGCTKIGGVSFPSWGFNEAPEIYAGFKSEIENNSDATVLDLTYATGFDAASIQTATQNVLLEEVDCIFGMSSGIDYVYPELQGTNVKLVSMGYDDSVESLMNNGQLIAAGNNNHAACIASCFVRIMNAVSGKQYSDAQTGEYNRDGIINGVASYPVITNLDELNDYKTYIIPTDLSSGPITAEELKEVMLEYNADATLASLNELTNRTMSEVKAARQ